MSDKEGAHVNHPMRDALSQQSSELLVAKAGKADAFGNATAHKAVHGGEHPQA